MSTAKSRLWRTISIAALVVLTIVPLSIASAAEEEGGNNLSVPVIWADGSSLALPTDTYVGTLPYFNPAEQVLADDGTTLVYPQQGTSRWEADNIDATTTVPVALVDWGDNLEAKAWPANSQVRVETTLKADGTGMLGYAMRHISGLGVDELWGATGADYLLPSAEYDYAHVYTNQAMLIIQPIDPTVTYHWTGTAWADPDGNVPVAVVPLNTATAEVNIQGKIVYGYNWTAPNAPGLYRITFVLPTTSEASLATAAIDMPEEETLAALAGPGQSGQGPGGPGGGSPGGGPPPGKGKSPGGTAYVDGGNNLTYVDMYLTAAKGRKVR